MRKKIGECLIHAGLITEDALDLALAEHLHTGERVGAALVRMQFTTETDVARALASQLGFPYVDLTENPPDPMLVALIPKHVALERACVAVGIDQGTLTVAMSDPLRFTVVQDLARHTGHHIQQAIAPLRDIVGAIEGGYPEEPPRPERAARHEVEGPTDTAPVDFVESVLQRAVASGATDVHIEPFADGLRVRHRVDGVLVDAMRRPASAPDALIAALKSRAGMDADEQRLPQDGRLRVASADGVVHFRLSTLRTVYGEKAVLRVLARQDRVPSLSEIGLSATSLELVRELVTRPCGLLLVAGPAGSGRTTTAGAALESVTADGRHVITIEDPVEYRIAGANQTEIDGTGASTFSGALRSILDRDVDVIFVGDMPDAETAALATRASLNGRLVLSTLPAVDAPAAVSRLRFLAIEPAAIASALVGVVAQRLVRRLCPNCRRPYRPSRDLLHRLDLLESAAVEPVAFFAAVGCDQCHYAGYRGRTGLYEVMTITDTLRRAIASDAPEDQLRSAARADGLLTIGDDGLSKVKSGVTSVEELMRVVAVLRDVRALCAACGAAVGPEFRACARCGKRLGERCRHCARELQPGWRFCPFCARAAGDTTGRGRPIAGEFAQ